MSKLGTHTNQAPTGLGAFLQQTHDAGSPVSALFALDIDVMPDILSKSPSTKLVFRTQQFGADNGNMYSGDPIAAGRARVDQCLPVLLQNLAHYYAIINEPGRSDVEGLTWLCNFYIGAMQRADELGIKLCVGEWSTGMPPISVAESIRIVEWLANVEDKSDQVMILMGLHSVLIPFNLMGNTFELIDYIAIYIPMLRYAMSHGHILGLHEYSLNGPMIGSPLCLRYRDLYAALPVDARPLLMISEAGPGAGYGTGYTMQAYVDVVAAYDAEVMNDSYVLGVALFKLGAGESNMAEVMPLLTDYVASHPTPVPPPVGELVFQHYQDMLTGAILSTDPNYDLTLLGDMHVKAQYVPKAPPPIQLHEFILEVDPPSEAQRVTQTPSGTMFPHGQVIQLRAT